jgi:CRP-like cAMP-binding protein
MEPYERQKLADAFTELSFSAGEYIIKEGDQGDDLYLV